MCCAEGSKARLGKESLALVGSVQVSGTERTSGKFANFLAVLASVEHASGLMVINLFRSFLTICRGSHM